MEEKKCQLGADAHLITLLGVSFCTGISNGTKSSSIFNDSRHWPLYRTYQVILN